MKKVSSNSFFISDESRDSKWLVVFERATKVDATIILDSYGKWESSNRAAILRLKTAA